MAIGGVGWGAMQTGRLAYEGGRGGAHVVAGTGRVIGKTTAGACAPPARSSSPAGVDSLDDHTDYAQR